MWFPLSCCFDVIVIWKGFLPLCIFFIATKAFKASKRSCPFGLWLETSKHPKEFSIHWGCILGGHRDGDCYIPTWFSRTLMVAPSLHCQRHHKMHPANHTWDCEKVQERQRCTKPFWGVSCPFFPPNLGQLSPPFGWFLKLQANANRIKHTKDCDACPFYFTCSIWQFGQDLLPCTDLT